MQTRAIGRDQVGAIGFGGAPISLRPDRPSDDEGVAVVHAALDAGVTLFDTADVYTPAGTGRGHSEALIARALRERGLSADASDRRVVVATKGGKHWDAAGEVQIDASPAALMKACDASLEALGVDTISLYQLHAVDPLVPLEDSIGALAELRRLGKIEQIGISNVDVSELDRARSVAEIVSVQNQYSPALRIEDPVLERCEELGIAFMPWGPLTGFRGRDGDSTSAVVARFSVAAEALHLSVARVVLAWELARSPVMLPIPGATRIESVVDSAAAAGETLDPSVAEWLSGLGPGPSGLGN
jgi:aryl-alcohol dehydrogenase-like predicted oxidoreductase